VVCQEVLAAPCADVDVDERWCCAFVRIGSGLVGVLRDLRNSVLRVSIGTVAPPQEGKHREKGEGRREKGTSETPWGIFIRKFVDVKWV
jgi:hypothetical protein